MAQTIKLKRSSTEGKTPTTSQLALGELAINTYDGRIFFKKNDGSDEIVQVLTTSAVITGSLSLTGTLTLDTLDASELNMGTTTMTSLGTQNSETDVLTINDSNVVGTRQLGSNAFNSTSFGTGSVTNVTVGTLSLIHI